MNGGDCSCSTLPWSTSVSHRVLCHRRLNKNFLSRRCSARSLSSRGYSLDFKLSDDPNLALKRFGNYLYVGLIIFAPAVDRFGGSFNQAAVLDFVDSGRDLIIVLGVNSSDFIREIATECGVDFDELLVAVIRNSNSRVKELKEKAEELKGVKEDLKVRMKQTTHQLHKHVDGVWKEAEETAKKVVDYLLLDITEDGFASFSLLTRLNDAHFRQPLSYGPHAQESV